jgi:hypothetical protein
MADIDKAITFDEQVELNVRDRTKGMEIEVDITEENPDFESFEELEDGNIAFGEPMPQEEEIDFYENLAEVLDDSDLRSLKNDLMGSINSDKESRSDWEKTYRDGLEYLGMKYEERSRPFEGASGVMHPLLAESVTQFQAQAYNELLPSQGPVKTQVIGMTTPETEQQAARVQEFMNYQLMQVMREYDSETDQMLFYLPLSGSAFRKVYYDQNLGRAVSKFIPSEDLIVPYGATDLHSATRFIDPYASACEQFSALAVNLGWPADQRTVLESVMFRESRCIPNVINGKDPNGGSRGLMQINGFWTPWLIERGLITSVENLLQADVNLRAALEIYNYGVDRYGYGWGPWSATR